LKAALDDRGKNGITTMQAGIASARGMTQIAKDPGPGRESLCKSLSAGDNPEYGTIFKVEEALGLKLRVVTSPKDETA